MSAVDRMNAQRASTYRRATLSAAAVAVALLGSGCSTGNSAGPGTGGLLPDRQPEVIVGEGSARLPSETVTDWVTYSDHVVVATVRSETPGRATPGEVERGEGLIGREVELSVERVLWSRGGARAVPTTFRWEAAGWVFKNAAGVKDPLEDASKFAIADSPRVEVGHTYVMALQWEEARCAPGDDPEPAHWDGLGPTGLLPFDSVAGIGEFQGRPQSLEQARDRIASLPDGGPRSFADLAVGRDANWLALQLRSARPAEQEDFGPPPAPC